MAQTFISFSSKDIETALRVHDALTVRGIDCWISERDIPTGANFQIEIPKAIKKATVMILILSENANSSNNITDEIALAKKYHLELLPLKIDEYLKEDAFELSLATSQYIDLYKDFEKIIEEIAVTIKAINERQDNFAALLEKHSGDDVYKPHIKDWLLQEAKEMDLTKGQAEKIINQVLGRANKESEIEYLKLIEQVLEDGIVSSIEVLMLSKKAKQLGISSKRADELLAQEKKKLGIYDSSITEVNTVVPQPVTINSPSTTINETLIQEEKEGGNGDEKIRHQIRLDFWEQAIKSYRDSSTTLFTKRNPTIYQWLDSGSGVRGVAFTAIHKKNEMTIQLTIQRRLIEENKLVFDNLYLHKNNIENIFGNSLIWERLDNQKTSRISFGKLFDCFNRDNWPAIIDWLIESTIKFENAFKEPLQGLNALLQEDNDVSESNM
jgi:hypothetical protein